MSKSEMEAFSERAKRKERKSFSLQIWIIFPRDGISADRPPDGETKSFAYFFRRKREYT